MSYRITCEVLVPVTLSLELESLNAESIKKAVLSDLEKGGGQDRQAGWEPTHAACKSALENVVVMSNEEWSYCMENPGAYPSHFYLRKDLAPSFG